MDARLRPLIWPLLGLFRRADGRVAWAVVAAFVAIQAVVFYNATWHDPRVGYDADGHRAYIKVLATQHRLPTAAETHEFFSPPLPYVPAAIMRWWWNADSYPGRMIGDQAAKIGQYVQATCSIPLTLAVMALARAARPRRDAFAVGCALLCLGMLPVYYKSFAMLRGEPPMAAFAMVGALIVVRAYALSPRPTLVAGGLAGAALGLACLSRQWAFFLLPPLGLLGIWRLVVDAPHRGATLRAGIATLACAALIAGPFYAHLYRNHGSVRAFNRAETSVGGTADRDKDEDDRAARPREPRAPLSAAIGRLVRSPIRDSLVDHPLLLVYADAWGDYWQYYLIAARDRRGNHIDASHIAAATADGTAKASTYRSMPPYLGRVNVASLVPTAVLAAGFATSLVALGRYPRRAADGRRAVLPTVGLCAAASIAGYAWFVATYPSDRADTVKATYLLNLYPLLAVAAAAMLARLRDASPRLAWGAVIAMLAVLAFDAPAFFTRAARDVW